MYPCWGLYRVPMSNEALHPKPQDTKPSAKESGTLKVRFDGGQEVKWFRLLGNGFDWMHGFWG